MLFCPYLGADHQCWAAEIFAEDGMTEIQIEICPYKEETASTFCKIKNNLTRKETFQHELFVYDESEEE